MSQSALLFLLPWHKRAVVRSKRGKTCTQLHQRGFSGSIIFTSFLFDPQSTPATRRSRETGENADWLLSRADSILFFLPVNADLWPQTEAALKSCLCSVYKVSSTRLYITLMEQWEEPWGCQCSQQFWGHLRLRGRIFRSVIQWRPWGTPARVTHEIHNTKHALYSKMHRIKATFPITTG